MEAPRLPSIFRNVQKEPKRFRLKSRHYNPKESELEKRKLAIQREVGMEDGVSAAPPKINITQRRKERGTYRSSSRQSFIRLMAILAALLFVAYKTWQWLSDIAAS
ncbi:MAG: hypothetical protein HRT74_02935 [Flavobacteriales bacterium]|nr:hypothetical protein [Flavobacteriales bacterium]